MALRDVDVRRVLERLGIETKRQGRELWARCPFHEERSASWRCKDDSTSEHHGIWQCFGSCPEGRRSGSIVHLVRALLDLPTREDAWRWIREKGAEAPRKAPSRVEIVLGEQRPVLVLPEGVVVAPVAAWVSPARRYLVDVRGVTPEQAERWELGYAAQGLLAGRIVIPVRDGAGRLLNYTARTYVGAEKKFREPDKADGADKGSVFGERHWPAPGARRAVAVTEAALCALAVERATGMHVAAILGSELLPGHVARVGSFEEIVILPARDAAASKLLGELKAQLGRWAKVRTARLPGGTDPDLLASRSLAELAAVVRDAA